MSCQGRSVARCWWCWWVWRPAGGPGLRPRRWRAITAGRVGRAGLGTLSDLAACCTGPEATAALLPLERRVDRQAARETATSHTSSGPRPRKPGGGTMHRSAPDGDRPTGLINATGTPIDDIQRGSARWPSVATATTAIRCDERERGDVVGACQPTSQRPAPQRIPSAGSARARRTARPGTEDPRAGSHARPTPELGSESRVRRRHRGRLGCGCRRRRRRACHDECHDVCDDDADDDQRLDLGSGV